MMPTGPYNFILSLLWSRVSILVLLDDAYRPYPEECKPKPVVVVSILVLLDDAYRPICYQFLGLLFRKVSILVLLDDAYRL